MIMIEPRASPTPSTSAALSATKGAHGVAARRDYRSGHSHASHLSSPCAGPGTVTTSWDVKTQQALNNFATEFVCCLSDKVYSWVQREHETLHLSIPDKSSGIRTLLGQNLRLISPKLYQLSDLARRQERIKMERVSDLHGLPDGSAHPVLKSLKDLSGR
ncbi:hypothetical protein PoB_002653100 [Plakobranchus ocellatus]|uniref:Uncharacterized protein n=1 Tax=Plakobranchus ocellatus TaxID=259542 RepID=A0AAV3ZLM7_9GAST|nr:hypothetical protein PoB_002653100 [Plakobranchus ocellatus]